MDLFPDRILLGKIFLSNEEILTARDNETLNNHLCGKLGRMLPRAGELLQQLGYGMWVDDRLPASDAPSWTVWLRKVG